MTDNFPYITPRSILDDRVGAIERTWATLLEGLKVRQTLSPNLNTDDFIQLDKVMKMYGSPQNFFSYDKIPKSERIKFLRRINQIHRTAGTEDSVQQMAKLLCADQAYRIDAVGVKSGDWRLTYGGYSGAEARYDGLHRYDRGLEHARQYVEVFIPPESIPPAEQQAFKDRFKRAWKIFQPSRFFLNIN